MRRNFLTSAHASGRQMRRWARPRLIASQSPGDIVKHRLISLAALGAAVLVSGCVAYPVDGTYRGGYYGDRNDHRDYRGGRDCRDDRNCDRRGDGRHDRDDYRGDERGPRP
jgi:hypothetical protein